MILSAHRIIWHDLEAERYAIEKVLPNCATVYGNQDLEEREENHCWFFYGEIARSSRQTMHDRIWYQPAAILSWAIYLGIGFKFNDFIQSIHRLLRFLQTALFA
jgi:hypothetical protein